MSASPCPTPSSTMPARYMQRLQRVHPIAGSLALVLIATFWLATVIVELMGSPDAVAIVKSAIALGLLALIPSLAAAGASGFALGAGRCGRRLDAKRRRMRLAAANGVLVLVPAALWLAARARSGDLDASFYTVQSLELAAGAANAVLLARNLRDGRAMTRSRHRNDI